MEKILKGAKFGDRFLTRDGFIAVYLTTNKKEGHSVIVAPSTKPYHYDDNGIFYAQTETENKDDIVSKLNVDSRIDVVNDVLNKIMKDVQKFENDVFNEIDFCKKHNMEMEIAALRYKLKAIDEFRGIIYKQERNNC